MEKSKGNFSKTKFLLQTVPLQEILQQNLILSTNCSKKKKRKKENPFYYKMILHK